jgi:hypothetical protein
VLRLQQQVGNRAVVEVLAGRGPFGFVQRRVDLSAPVRKLFWHHPTRTNADAGTMKAWLRNADLDLGDHVDRQAVLDNPAKVRGASYLGGLDGALVTKRYSYDGTATAPDAFVTSLDSWSALAGAPDHFRTFLVEVWTDARNFPAHQKANAIYDLYGGQTAGHPVPETSNDAEYFTKTLEPFLAQTVPQFKLVAQLGYFMHAESPGWATVTPADQGASRRFYFNPGPSYLKALQAFVTILRDVVLGYHGKGKVVSPGQYGARSDSIVIWIPPASAKAAKNYLATTSITDFGATTSGPIPPMLKRLTGEIGTGTEPTNRNTMHSFGTLRAAILANALHGAPSFDLFLARAFRNFRHIGIPWDAPHKGG